MITRLTMKDLREKFDWILSKADDYSIDNSWDRVFLLYCISVVRLFPHEELDDELFQLRCANEGWIETNIWNRYEDYSSK